MNAWLVAHPDLRVWLVPLAPIAVLVYAWLTYKFLSRGLVK